MSTRLSKREKELGVRAVMEPPGDGRAFPTAGHRLPSRREKLLAEVQRAVANAGRPRLAFDRTPSTFAAARFTVDQVIDGASSCPEAQRALEDIGGKDALRAMSGDDQAAAIDRLIALIAVGDGDSAADGGVACACGVGDSHADCCTGKGTGYQFGRPLPLTT